MLNVRLIILQFTVSQGDFHLSSRDIYKLLNTFLKLHQTKKENCILYCVLIDQRETIESRINVINWSSKVRNLLQNAGFGDVWLFPDSVNSKLCIPVLRTRLRDTHIPQWREGLELCTSLYLFREFKTVFKRSSQTIFPQIEYRDWQTQHN